MAMKACLDIMDYESYKVLNFTCDNSCKIKLYHHTKKALSPLLLALGGLKCENN